ncbi:hypothetical protein [Niabella ginsengisoli]|uniref:Outer membrane protein beta-barrel domain-containing protein n=1 Tax=Niabella ginsengisoli TaxID=522298 RepID=A0ABS9SG80_9BACT|nr:hypothetical protein [Niabella ginsengisoli]MCH5597373.1 hypothetical protein [Niabella ginsengisoli]
MTDPNDDIINYIKSALQSHEEPYDEGSWERFAAKHTAIPVRKKPVIALWVTAAAAVIIGVILFARIFNNTNVTDIPVETYDVVIKNNTDTNIENEIINETLPQIDNAQVNPKISDNNQQQLAVTKSIAAPAFNNNAILPAPNPVTPSYQPTQQPIASNAPIIKEEKQQEKKVDFWRNNVVDNKNNVTTTNTPKEKESNILIASTVPKTSDRKQSAERNSRWQPSLYVSPLFGELGINMGYGVSLGYAINDKIKISSGIAHTKLSASRAFDPTAPAGGVANAMASAPVDLAGSKNSLVTYNSSTANSSQIRTLQQVDASLSGIDIPVEINYSINKKLYATAGVSALVVINDNKTYTFADSRNVKISVETNKGTLKEDRSVMFNEQSTSNNQPSQVPTENTPLLGFYNISLGYRQKISDKNAVSLEPFIKVPMKNVTQQNLKYMGTGIRLKFDL